MHEIPYLYVPSISHSKKGHYAKDLLMFMIRVYVMLCEPPGITLHCYERSVEIVCAEFAM